MSEWDYCVLMHGDWNPNTTHRDRNPLYKYMKRNQIRAHLLAKQIGYETVGALYKAMRYATVPDPDKATKIGRLIGKTQGEVLELWHRERARRAA